MARTDKKHKAIFDEFTRYHSGEMSHAEQFILEKQILEDPFLAEAFDGFKIMLDNKSNHSESISSLNQRLEVHLQEKQKHPISFWLYATAATILLMMSISIYYFSRQTISQNAVSITSTKVTPERSTVKSPQITPAPETLKAFKTDKQLSTKTKKTASPVKKQPERAAAETGKTAPLLIPDQDVAISVPAGVELQPKSVPYTLAAPTASQPQRGFSNSKKISYTNVVSGKVTDARGEVLPGINVFYKRNQGVVTDKDGNFSIDVPVMDSLRLAGIGFKNKQVSVSQRDLGAIKLEEDVQALNEVVVVGYGTSKKQSFSARASLVKKPEPVLGWKKFNEYLDEKSKELAFKDSIKVTFQVNADGSLTDFNVEFPGDASNAAIEILKNGPLWSPAISQDVKVAEKISVTVKFGL